MKPDKLDNELMLNALNLIIDKIDDFYHDYYEFLSKSEKAKFINLLKKIQFMLDKRCIGISLKV